MLFSPVPIVDLRCPPASWLGWGSHIVENAAVCLDRHGHRSGVMLQVEKMEFPGSDDGGERVLALELPLLVPDVSQAMRDLYRNLQALTEQGAYAVALGTVLVLEGYEHCMGGRIGEGFDFLLRGGPIPEVRLEVSGILQAESDRAISRLREKLRQVNSYESPTPAYAAVVEFSRPRLVLGCAK